MTTRTTMLGWLALLVVTFLVAALNSGCGGSQAKPATATPKPLQTEDIPLVCLRVERGEDKGEAIFCGSQKMCDMAYAKLVSYWAELSDRYSLTGLSECTPVGARFTER